MKCIKHDLGSDRKQVKLITFSDVHIGSPKCDLILLKEYIEMVKSDEDCFALIAGDMLNNSTKTSVGDVYDEELSPMDQMKLAVSLFEPIKDKILCITSGNHERRTYKQDGTDLMWFFAKQLNLEKLYDYASCILFLRFGRISHNYGGCGKDDKVLYTIYVSHGDGQGGRTVGGKANGLERRGQIINGCDVIITGHTHNMISFKESHFYIDKPNANVKEIESTFVNSGSFLNYEQYAEIYGLKPTVKGSPTIILSGAKRKKVNVIL